jgi:hypothetical protein
MAGKLRGLLGSDERALICIQFWGSKKRSCKKFILTLHCARSDQGTFFPRAWNRVCERNARIITFKSNQTQAFVCITMMSGTQSVSAMHA